VLTGHIIISSGLKWPARVRLVGQRAVELVRREARVCGREFLRFAVFGGPRLRTIHTPRPVRNESANGHDGVEYVLRNLSPRACRAAASTDS